jgi:hypothetical protein
MVEMKVVSMVARLVVSRVVSMVGVLVLMMAAY